MKLIFLKRLKNAVLFSALLLLFTNKAIAQQSIHFTIGEEELAGAEIYDIIQDDEANYWIASDNGLIKYDGYKYKNIPTKGLLGNSVFEFNKQGKKRYCKNLSGQII